MSEKTNHPTYEKPVIIASGMLSHSFTGLDFHCLWALSKNILIIKVIAIAKLWNYNYLQVIILSNAMATWNTVFNQFHLFQVGDTFWPYSGKLVPVTGKFSRFFWCRLLRTCSSENDQTLLPQAEPYWEMWGIPLVTEAILSLIHRYQSLVCVQH